MSITETWRPIPSHPDYDVSDLGRVRRRLRNRANRGRVHVRKPKARSNGYLEVDLYADGRASYSLVHRLVLEAFVGPCPDGHEACHENGDKSDNRLANLRWDTRKANQHDRRRHGTHMEGEAHPMAKLGPTEVMRIREAFAGGAKSPTLAAEYGVHDAHIRSIVRGRTWKHLPLVERQIEEEQ